MIITVSFELESGVIALSCPDGLGIEPDPPTLTFTPDNWNVPQGVTLGSQPTDDVIVTLTVPEDTERDSPGTLTFTPDNWNVPQTITVTIDTTPITTDPPTLTFTPDNWNVPQTVVLSAPPAGTVVVSAPPAEDV